ncbi:hypothetical protein FZC79_13795 [Rossellomorea vietnamensis]|uniref:Uncharacterized protein n=1 Tax=Rossellomorea vietnamensis TaxID=218284 RepID=A0A5D4KCU2_9BACI|nr:hypothetical protein FZC79_13795 [Rossellomorea vietnamensis]
MRKERSVWRRALFLIKSGSAPNCSDRQIFRREKKAVFPFILFGLFDPEEQGAATGLNKKWIAVKWCQESF